MEMDHSELWAQIGFWTKARLGIVPGTLLRDADALLFSIPGCEADDGDPGEDGLEWLLGEELETERALRRRQFKIRLNGLDLYDITIGHLDRDTFNWVKDGEESDVHADELSETLLRMAGLEG